jgi:hypothetical protein
LKMANVKDGGAFCQGDSVLNFIDE